jgi:hypothetical protein
MKNKLRKLIFIAALATISVFSFFQPYDTGSEKTDTLRLSTIAQDAVENGIEEEPDPIIKPFGFWEWLESVLDGMGF